MAEAWNCSIEEYHASPGVSHSQLETFIDSELNYYERHVTGTLPRPDAAHFRWGSLLHSHILERSVVCIPTSELSRNGAAAGKKYEAFVAAHPGKHIVKQPEWEQLVACERALDRHPRASAILFSRDPDDVTELSIRWVDPSSGLLLRVRLDKRVWRPKLLGDLKSARSVHPRKFAFDAEQYGYHRQAALYQEGYEELTGERLPFVFLAVTNKEPYRAEVYEFDQGWIDGGHDENHWHLDRLARCLETGEFHEATHNRILLLKRPRHGDASQWSYDDDE